MLIYSLVHMKICVLWLCIECYEWTCSSHASHSWRGSYSKLMCLLVELNNVVYLRFIWYINRLQCSLPLTTTQNVKNSPNSEMFLIQEKSFFRTLGCYWEVVAIWRGVIGKEHSSHQSIICYQLSCFMSFPHP